MMWYRFPNAWPASSGPLASRAAPGTPHSVSRPAGAPNPGRMVTPESRLRFVFVWSPAGGRGGTVIPPQFTPDDLRPGILSGYLVSESAGTIVSSVALSGGR